MQILRLDEPPTSTDMGMSKRGSTRMRKCLLCLLCVVACEEIDIKGCIPSKLVRKEGFKEMKEYLYHS